MMSNSVLVLPEGQKPMAVPMTPQVTPDQLDLIRRTIAKDATPDELKLYLYDCQRQGVHPLDRLLHFTKRGGKYTPITSIDFMRIRAADTGEMAGSDDPIFDLDGKAVVAATVTVYRLTQGQRFAYTATARWTEYKPDQDFMWKRMPHTMLGKCAEALALRKGFPRQLAGLYAKEEMEQGDNQPAAVSIDTTPSDAAPAPTEFVNLGTGEVTPAPDPHWTSVAPAEEAVDAPASTERGAACHWIVRCKSGLGKKAGEVTFSDGTVGTIWTDKAALFAECQGYMRAVQRVTFTLKADKYNTLKEVQLYVDPKDVPF